MLTISSAFSGFATAWAEVLCPACVQGSKVLPLSKLLHYSSVTEYSLRQHFQLFTGDHLPVVKLLTSISFTFSLACPMDMIFIPYKSKIIIPELYPHYRGQGEAFFNTKLLNHVVVLSMQCPGERDGNCTITPFLKKHDTWGFSSQCGAGPGLHQDLKMRLSPRAHSWDICASSAWYQSKI